MKSFRLFTYFYVLLPYFIYHKLKFVILQIMEAIKDQPIDNFSLWPDLVSSWKWERSSNKGYFFYVFISILAFDFYYLNTNIIIIDELESM